MEAKGHFKTNRIDELLDRKEINPIFINCYEYYYFLLRKSIREHINSSKKNFRANPNYYTYLLMEGKGLTKLIKKLRSKRRGSLCLDSRLIDAFMELIFYVGKGCGKRKIMHLSELKLLLQKNPLDFRSNAKLMKIYKAEFKIWAK